MSWIRSLVRSLVGQHETLDETDVDLFHGSLGTWIMGAVSLMVGSGTVMVAVTALGVSTLVARYPVALPKFGATTEKIELAHSARYLALPRDGISAAEAGRLVLELRQERYDWTALCAEDVVPDSPIAAPLALRCLDHTLVFEATDRGLTLEERAHIEAHLDLPWIPVLEALARARGYDRPMDDWVSAAESAGEHTLVFDLPVPMFAGIRDASYAMVAQAALLQDEGRSDEAESVLREVVSAGLLLIDDGETLIEALIGTVMSRVGMEGLAELYERTWRQPEADDLRERLDAYHKRDRRAKALPGSRAGAVESAVAEFREALADPDAPRGLRWEALHALGMVQECGDPRAVLFGPSIETVELFDRARSDLVRSQASAKRFEIFRTTIERLAARTRLTELEGLELAGEKIGGWTSLVGVPVELTAWALQNPSIDGCFWAYALSH